MKLNSEMNAKYNTINHLDKLICVENEDIIKIEKKFEAFTVDNNYNYAINIITNKNELPKINIDLQKLIAYNKSTNDSIDDLTKEISIINDYYQSLTKWVDMSKCESEKEKSLIYYLFYLNTRCFFYLIMSNNFMCSQTNKIIFQIFFKNFVQILTTAKLYLEEDIDNSSMQIDDKNNITSEKYIENGVKEGLYKAFDTLKKSPNEFTDAVTRCQNFITLALFSVDQNVQIDGEEENSIIDDDMLHLLQIFVTAFSILKEVNEYFSIIDYKMFYNDSISKNLNIRREFSRFLKNQKIKEKQKKEKDKDKNEKEKSKDEEEYNKNNNDDEDEDLSNNDKIEFTLFDYMWLFNPASKNEIIRLFNIEKQNTELAKILNMDRDRGLNVFDFIFNRKKYNFVLNIRRDHLIEDTLNEVSKPNVNFEYELKVKFVGEQGVDEGGVRKEFFILLIRQIFDPNYGMFSYNSKTRLYWFNHYSFEPKIKYELIGVIFGLAIYNNTILDVKLPITVYKKLLGIKPTLEDMKECDPELYHTLNYLKNNNDANLKEEIDTNFTVIDDKFGEKLVKPLKENGENIMIDINNKDEYVDLYIDWYFNESIKDFFNSFEKGFYRVFSKNLTKVLTPEELELILCGTQILDFHELKNACQYEEYEKDSETIKYFWEILLDFKEEEKKKFLSFVTGCDRAPIDGLGSLSITISNGGSDINQLPSAHTCFNNLILPDYKNKEKMKKAILTAINYSEGFGLI